jgi:hypothetical protein
MRRWRISLNGSSLLGRQEIFGDGRIEVLLSGVAIGQINVHSDERIAQEIIGSPISICVRSLRTS